MIFLIGGVSVISYRNAKANNPCLPDYNPTKEESYLWYVDANNLYGWAMSRALPMMNLNGVMRAN